MYHGLRNVNVCAASFLRPAERGEPGYVEDERERQVQMDQTREDVREINRLVDVLFAFLRTALRERRHGYRVAKNASGGSAKKNGGWRKTRGGGTGFVPDELLVTEDLTGSPSLSTFLFTDAERAEVPHARSSEQVQRRRRGSAPRGSHRRRNGYAKKRARDVPRVRRGSGGVQDMRARRRHPSRTSTCTWSTWCFSASCSARRSCSAPPSTGCTSARPAALGFYGIWEVGKTVMDPFDWNSPCVDLTAIGRRVADEGGRIARAARKRRRSTRAGASRGRARRRVRRITRRAFRRT